MDAAAMRLIPHYTFDDWVRWEGLWELIDGVPFAMAPAPSPKHQLIAVRLTTAFQNALDATACDECQVYQPIDYLVSDDNILLPDLLVVCGEIKGQQLRFPPALIAEILSPSTALKDRNPKFKLYESQKVPYFLILSPEKQEVEVWQFIGSAYQLVKQGRDIGFDFNIGACSIHIAFEQVWR